MTVATVQRRLLLDSDSDRCNIRTTVENWVQPASVHGPGIAVKRFEGGFGFAYRTHES